MNRESYLDLPHNIPPQEIAARHAQLEELHRQIKLTSLNNLKEALMREVNLILDSLPPDEEYGAVTAAFERNFNN